MTDGTDRDNIIEILTRYTTVKDRALYEYIQPVGFDPSRLVDLRSFEDGQNWFRKLGLQNRKVDSEKLVDNQFVDYANARILGR